MARIFRLIAGLVSTLGVLQPAQASTTTWRCELTQDLVRLVCAADASAANTDEAHPPPDRAVASSRASPPGTVVNGTAFPLDARRVYSVELWSVPTEADFVVTLARATICYRSPGCTVHVQLPPDLERLASLPGRRVAAAGGR